MELRVILKLFLPMIFLLTSDGLPKYEKRVTVSESTLPNNPFIVLWNSPTFKCHKAYGITLNLHSFGIVANQNGSFRGDRVVIFYERDLGYYPFYKDDGTTHFGGLPQLGNLTLHLQKVADDINIMIPDPSFDGVAVIDWESWDPIFDRNGYNHKMKIYKQKSEELVRLKHPNWKNADVKNSARRDFEAAARNYMLTTLELVRKMRPQGHWGYYLFPKCYNYVPGHSSCADKIMLDNDKLQWLFKASSVIVPSIYLKENVRSSSENYAYVQGIVMEALRVKDKFSNPEVPVLAYTRYRYADTLKFYDVIDLHNTITEVFNAGAGGVIMWDSSQSYSNRSSCKQMNQYLNSLLGPFIRNITSVARACSLDNCKAHGRCRKEVKITTTKRNAYNLRDSIQDPMLTNFLNIVSNKIIDVGDNEHMLPVATFKRDAEKEQANEGEVLSKGVAATCQYVSFENYRCNCFYGWSGKHCENHLTTVTSNPRNDG